MTDYDMRADKLVISFPICHAKPGFMRILPFLISINVS